MKNEFQEKAKANIVPHYVDLFIGFLLEGEHPWLRKQKMLRPRGSNGFNKDSEGSGQEMTTLEGPGQAIPAGSVVEPLCVVGFHSFIAEQRAVNHHD